MKLTVLLCFSVAMFLTSAEGQASAPIPSGRWEIQTTSGDQPAQLATGTPVIFNGIFVCFGGACGSPQIYTYDTSICDHAGFANIGNGLVINANTAALQFEVSGGTGGDFLYSFLGTLTETWTASDGLPLLTSATITGSYGSTPGGCNNGISNDQGTFIGYWYPPITGTYVGELLPEEKGGAVVGLELTLSQETMGGLAGALVTGELVHNLRTGAETFIPKQSPCFSSMNLVVSQGQGPNLSYVSGSKFKIFALDSNGNSLILAGNATTARPNSSYQVDYTIDGGVCSGQTGTNAHFSPPVPQSPTAPRLPPRRIGVHPSPDSATKDGAEL